MIADIETNVVLVADTLESRFPVLHRSLASILGGHGIPFKVIPGTRDMWCQDYMPIQRTESRFVQFRYEPDYLTGEYRCRRADGGLGPTLNWLPERHRSDIELDGGNVVSWGDRAIVTEKVFRENPWLPRQAVTTALRGDLGLSELIIVTGEPDDPIGHSDGMACWLGERSVLINDYSTTSEAFRRRIHRSFARHQVDVIELPYEPQAGGREELPTAAGNWINFLRVRDLLVVPIFGLKGDERALGVLRDAYPGCAVQTVGCRDPAEEGGSIHGVTWQVRIA